MRRLRTLTIVGAALAAFVAAGPAATAQTATDTTPPTKPGNLRVLEATDRNIELGWDESTDDSGVVIYFLVLDDHPPNIMGSGMTTHDVEFNRAVGLIPGSTHTFQLHVEDPSGNVTLSDEITASFLPGDNTPPTAPSDLRVVGVTQDGVELAWKPATDESGFSHFVQAHSSVCGPIEVSGDTTRVLHPIGGWCGVTRGQTHEFDVRAIDELRNVSEFSNTVSVFVP